MDAKTMRAALTAALRVTVSTSLIGCGAHTSTDGAGGGTRSDTSRSDDEQAPDRAEQQGGKLGTESDAGAGAGGTSSNAMGGSSSGSATGGSASDGGWTTAGEGGEGGAGTKPATPCEAVAACLDTLEAMTFQSGQPLPSAAAECCTLVIEGLSSPREAAVCDSETSRALDLRFMGSPVRSACCADPETWQHIACTPWGPPVPPELPDEALAAWGLRA